MSGPATRGTSTSETRETPRVRTPDETPPPAPTRIRNMDTRSAFSDSIDALELFHTEVREQSRDALGLWLLLQKNVPPDLCLSILQSMYNKNPKSHIAITRATGKEFRLETKKVEISWPSFPVRF